VSAPSSTCHLCKAFFFFHYLYLYLYFLPFNFGSSARKIAPTKKRKNGKFISNICRTDISRPKSFSPAVTGHTTSRDPSSSMSGRYGKVSSSLLRQACSGSVKRYGLARIFYHQLPKDNVVYRSLSSLTFRGLQLGFLCMDLRGELGGGNPQQ
jgi:hypothetical protein